MIDYRYWKRYEPTMKMDWPDFCMERAWRLHFEPIEDEL